MKLSKETLLFPAFLYGQHREVVKKCKSMARKAISSRRLPTEALGELADINDFYCDIVLSDGSNLSSEDCNILVYPVFAELIDVAFSSQKGTREECHLLIESIVLPAMDEFWVCLAALSSNGRLLPRWPDPQRQARTSLAIVEKLLRWWPAFCTLNARFRDGFGLSRSGHHWGKVVWHLVEDLGEGEQWIEKQKDAAPEDVADMLLDVILSARRRLARGQT